VSADLRAEAARVNWFHSIELAPGFVTPGRTDTRAQVERLHLPASLAGKTVLDVGAWDGYFSFEAERRGAERVVARIGQVGDLRFDRQVEVMKPRDRPLEPLAPSSPLGRQRCLERRVVGVHPEAEDMKLALPQAEVAGDDGVDLDARHECQARRDRTRNDDLAIAREGVVVGQRE